MGMMKDLGTALKKDFKSMPFKEKIKTVTRGICGIGAGLICGTLARKYIESEDAGVLESTIVVATSLGAAWWLGETAATKYDEMIDLWYEVREGAADYVAETLDNEEEI